MSLVNMAGEVIGINALFSYAPGDTVKLEGVRGKSNLTLTVTLGESKP